MNKTYARRRAVALAVLAGVLALVISLEPIKLIFRLLWNFYATIFGHQYL